MSLIGWLEDRLTHKQQSQTLVYGLFTLMAVCMGTIFGIGAKAGAATARRRGRRSSH